MSVGGVHIGVGKRLQDGWGNGCEKVVVEWRLAVSVPGLGNGCIVVELALRLPRSGRVGSHRVN